MWGEICNFVGVNEKMNGMTTRNIVVAAVLAVVTALVCRAEFNGDMFNVLHLSTDDGLSNNRVFSIVEDQHHAMWIGTKNGIDRYNGTSVVNYRLPVPNATEQGGSRHHMHHDAKQGLWVFDNIGRIFRYNRRTNDFELVINLLEKLGGEVVMNALCTDATGRFWIGLKSGLYLWDGKSSLKCVLKDHYVNAVTLWGNTVAVGTNDGLWLVTEGKKPLHRLPGLMVQSLLSDVNALWVGSFQGGLHMLTGANASPVRIAAGVQDFSKPIREIVKFDQNTLLVGIDGGGVYTLNLASLEARQWLSTDDSRANFLNGNGVYAVHKDYQGNVWVGSYTGGVSVALREPLTLNILRHERGNYNSLKDNSVNSIEENIDGCVWCSTSDGISIYNPATMQWRHCYTGTASISMSHMAGGNVWVGTYGEGAYLFDRNGNTLKHLTQSENSLTNSCVMGVMVDSDGDLWTGSIDGVVMCFDANLNVKGKVHTECVMALKPLDGGRMAAATVNGFTVIDKETFASKRYSTAQEGGNRSSYIVAMYFPGDGTAWLGTEGGGLVSYDMTTRKSKAITTADGLPSDEVFGILGDSQHRLWVSTGNGLAMVENGRVSNLNYLGPIEMSYNRSSACAMVNGKMAFGGDNGVVVLNPASVASTAFTADLRITGVTVRNIDDATEHALRASIHDMLGKGKVELASSNNSFHIDFEAINYRYKNDIVYQYILENCDKQWSTPSHDGAVDYHNVAPGNYTFKVRCLRLSDGKVIDEQSLRVVVLEAWYNTVWAWLLYLTVVAAFIYVVFRYKIYQEQKRHNEEKIGFFINTAHDIRTPVSLIAAPLEDLSKEEDLSPEAQYLVDTALSGSRKLKGIVTELLDFEKLDTRRAAIKLESVCLNDVLIEEAEAFATVFELKQLNLHVDVPEENVCSLVDRSLFERMLDNLISNAYKYTNAGGEVWLTLSETRGRAIVTVRDTGSGIPESIKDRIFKEVVRADAVKSITGTGFGLLHVSNIVRALGGKIQLTSEEGRGTTVEVALKMTNQLPVAHDKPRPEASPEAIAAQTGDDAPKDNTLLIVEDNDDMRMYLNRFFGKDYNVKAVPNGNEALSYLKTEYPDIIISDVMMPGIQGDELCRIIKNNPETSGIPVILLTAKTGHDAVVSGLKGLADDYIVKPFDNDILRLKVRNIIENRNRRRARFLEQASQAIAQPAQQPAPADAAPAPQPTMSENDRTFMMRATQQVVYHMADTEFSIDDMCKEMAMSRTLFYNRLKSLTGKSPQEFIRDLRLEKAAQLIVEGHPITEVADETGFTNVKYFSVVFKKHYGVQPSKYTSNG